MKNTKSDYFTSTLTHHQKTEYRYLPEREVTERHQSLYRYLPDRARVD